MFSQPGGYLEDMENCIVQTDSNPMVSNPKNFTCLQLQFYELKQTAGNLRFSIFVIFSSNWSSEIDVLNSTLGNVNSTNLYLNYCKWIELKNVFDYWGIAASPRIDIWTCWSSFYIFSWLCVLFLFDIFKLPWIFVVALHTKVYFWYHSQIGIGWCYAHKIQSVLTIPFPKSDIFL